MANETNCIFRPLNADDPEPETTEIESLCMLCHETGMTRLLLTKIPFFKEVVVSSFDCDHCGHQNSELLSGGRTEERGIRFTLSVKSIVDLNRQVCKSDYSSIHIPELEFEIPSRSQKGGITSVEGVIDRSIEGLEQDQQRRREEDPESAEKIEAFLDRLRQLKIGETPFTFILEDISGNAFISNPRAPLKDDQLVESHFIRTKEQDEVLGVVQESRPGQMKPVPEEDFALEDIIQDVMQFATNCPECRAPCETNMKMTKIPFFKEVVIMATNCDQCGHRSNEVKSGGGIAPKGWRAEIKITKPEDLTRDLLKSETCSLEIPELELEVGPRALGGRFTTVEGLLQAMKEQLCESNAMFMDSQDPEGTQRMKDFLERFTAMIRASSPFTLILDDPAGNSYVQSMEDSEESDSALTISHYERTSEQNDDLGITDMKTEDYQETNEEENR